MTPMMGREFKRFACWFGCAGYCVGCQMTLSWNLMGRRCECGEKATGYRVMAADVPVEFFCDEHFQDVPIVADSVVRKATQDGER